GSARCRLRPLAHARPVAGEGVARGAQALVGESGPRPRAGRCSLERGVLLPPSGDGADPRGARRAPAGARRTGGRGRGSPLAPRGDASRARADPGVPEALAELRRRGIGTAIVSNCTEEVALVWGESPFAGLVDVPIFSATAGCLKPEPEIYELACSRLGVRPVDCFFVGDGANDELAGARRVGMEPVLIHPPGGAPLWDGLASWDGLPIT